MTPTITTAMTYSKEPQTLTHKLRKPLVEKFRRERINSCIEQLKSLLGPEFLKQQPDSKLEKADILEMTVCFMRQQLQYKSSSCSAYASQGYSRCFHEMVHFLSKDETKTQSHHRLLNHFQNSRSSSDDMKENSLSQCNSPVQHGLSEVKSSVNSALWRPW
ncbi:transcription factor HES-5-like [Lampris incognitus]|uniref:transcription factor HES-5-like n=1 Tax=Lampris incognitus TaxID=2546036 RepID=UPI0024B487BF|nr:transcription factor HES-5-like [Lampris incognitus]